MRVMISIAAVALGLVACREPEPTDGASAEEQRVQAGTAAAASTEPGNNEEPKTETMSKITKTDEEWRAQLTEEQYRITRKKGTERAFTGKYWNNKEKGIYTCVGCGTPLFDSETKYESGTGWPSFWAPITKENVAEEADNSLFMRRTEVLCGRCDAHLGHVFDDGPKPTGLRYCINSAALEFKKKE